MTNIHQIRVYYADTDAGGIVHHSAYLRFLEQARTEHLRQSGIGLQLLFEKCGTMFAIKTINISYIKPVRLDDLLYIKTTIREIRKVSIIYEQAIHLAELDGNMVCSAEIKLACVNASMQPCVLPNIFKQFIICKMENY